MLNQFKGVILPLDGHMEFKSFSDAIYNLFTDSNLKEIVSHIKVNDAVHLCPSGPQLVRFLTDKGLKVFLDLKIRDTSGTIVNTLKHYQDSQPDILTVSESCSAKSFLLLRRNFPGIKLALVSALTDFSKTEFFARYGMSPEIKILNDVLNIQSEYEKIRKEADPLQAINMIVCSPYEVAFLKKNLGDKYEFIVPGIRDEWMEKGQQERCTGLEEAVSLGATYAVMGSQLTKGNPNKGITPEESQKRTLEIISSFFDSKIVFDDPIQTLKNYGALYQSPVDDKKKLLGPLVGYAGKYTNEEGELKNFVGSCYFNMARIETDSVSRSFFSDLIVNNLNKKGISADKIVGMAMGGIKISQAVGDDLRIPSIFAEKKVTALANPDIGVKASSKLIISRHDIVSGEKVIICEDLCNNFSTTQKAIDLIQEKGAKVVAITCIVNRSDKKTFNSIPVVSAVDIPSSQFKQEDEEVRDLIELKNIVWNPKQKWSKLKKAMEKS